MPVPAGGFDAQINQITDMLMEASDLVRNLQQPEVAQVVIPPAAVVAPEEPANDDASFAFENYDGFYNWLRGNNMIGPKISADEFEGCDTIIRACALDGWPVSFVAYALATAYHETAHTMQPIKELGGATYFTRMYDIRGNRPAKARELGNLNPGDGAKYPGRGYVQLTGKDNYRKATKVLRDMGYDVDLVANPDLAMDPLYAAIIMVTGMRDGWFTTRKISDDLPAKGPATLGQFIASRDVINGRDKDDEIAAYATDWQLALLAGGYKIAA